jgi:hypothetical protein
MKKPLLFITYLITILLFNSSFTDKYNDEENCLKKLKGEWGKGQGCTNRSKSYKVSFLNNCTDTLDIKLAVQERSLRWKTFKYFKVPPGDTISGYSCDATGKYISWKKTTDDASIVFPTDEEINRDNR